MNLIKGQILLRENESTTSVQENILQAAILNHHLDEPCHEKTRLLPMQKQRRRSAVQ